MGLKLVGNDHGRLMDELEGVRRRGVYRVFKRLDKQVALDVPILSRLAVSICPDLWRNGKRDEALASVLQAAIEQLPRGPLPDSDTDMSWQQAALIMYQIAPLPAAQIRRVDDQYSGKQEYVKRARYVQDYALPPDDDEALSRLNYQMRKQLAAALLENEVDMFAEKDPLPDIRGAATKAAAQSESGDTDKAPTDAVGKESVELPSAPEVVPEPAAEAPIPGMGGMTVTVTNSGPTIVGPNASQTNHYYK